MGGCALKSQKHDDVILEWSLRQILKVKRTKRPEMEVIKVCRHLHEKTREITLRELIFGGFLAIWNHSAARTERV